MNTITLSLTGSSNKQYITMTSKEVTETDTGSSISAQATASISYNGTTKQYSVGDVYLKLKGQPSGNTCTVVQT